MNWDFVLNQWVSIFHCNIYYLEKNGGIERAYGDVRPEANPLYTDADFLKMLAGREMGGFPDIYCEHDSLLYAMMPFEGKKLLIGPVSIVEPVRELEKYMEEKHCVGKGVHGRIGFCERKVFIAGVLVLWHNITGKECTAEELRVKNGLDGLETWEARASVQKVIFQRQETELPHNPYDKERRELDSIRRGDKEMLRRSIEETYRGEVGKLSRNEIRQAEYEFAECVSNIDGKKERNELIEKAKNFIFQNLHSEIVVGQIGRRIGVSAAYLSSLFRRVEGITIQQYIRREKIRLAENMLRYSEYDVKSIASYLAFCSQSHFGKVFKEETGMTPSKYRNKFKNYEKNKNW